MPEPMGTAPKDPNKIMGLSKPVFFILVAGVLVLAYYLYKRNQSSQDQAANSGVSPDQGLTAADIGGTPSDSGTPYDTSGGQGVDNSAQISALGDQLNSSLTDLSSQIAGLASSGVGPSSASPPDWWNTAPNWWNIPIKVSVTSTPTHQTKPKKKIVVHKPVHKPKKK